MKDSNFRRIYIVLRNLYDGYQKENLVFKGRKIRTISLSQETVIGAECIDLNSFKKYEIALCACEDYRGHHWFVRISELNEDEGGYDEIFQSFITADGNVLSYSDRYTGKHIAIEITSFLAEKAREITDDFTNEEKMQRLKELLDDVDNKDIDKMSKDHPYCRRYYDEKQRFDWCSIKEFENAAIYKNRSDAAEIRFLCYDLFGFCTLKMENIKAFTELSGYNLDPGEMDGDDVKSFAISKGDTMYAFYNLFNTEPFWHIA